MAILHSLLAARAIQSQAVCVDQFAWMDNKHQQSPCLVLAYVLGACQGEDFTVMSLPDANHHYTPPTSTTANECSCSWSAYNLYQACAACQGTDRDSSIFNWDPYSTNCTGFLSSTDPFPKDITLSNQTSIPFWATTNPDSWSNHRFDVQAAQTTALENKPDFSPPPTNNVTPSHKSNTGAIAGGVVGGIVGALLLGAAVHLWLRRRRSGSTYSGAGSRTLNSSDINILRFGLNRRSRSEITKSPYATSSEVPFSPSSGAMGIAGTPLGTTTPMNELMTPDGLKLHVVSPLSAAPTNNSSVWPAAHSHASSSSTNLRPGPDGYYPLQLNAGIPSIGADAMSPGVESSIMTVLAPNRPGPNPVQNNNNMPSHSHSRSQDSNGSGNSYSYGTSLSYATRMSQGQTTLPGHHRQNSSMSTEPEYIVEPFTMPDPNDAQDNSTSDSVSNFSGQIPAIVLPSGSTSSIGIPQAQPGPPTFQRKLNPPSYLEVSSTGATAGSGSGSGSGSTTVRGEPDGISTIHEEEEGTQSLLHVQNPNSHTTQQPQLDRWGYPVDRKPPV